MYLPDLKLCRLYSEDKVLVGLTYIYVWLTIKASRLNSCDKKSGHVEKILVKNPSAQDNKNIQLNFLQHDVCTGWYL